MVTDRRRWVLAALAVVFVSGAIPAGAQQFGQWSWDGALGLEGRRFDNRLGNDRLSGYQSQAVYLGLGLNGFIVHPAVARFRLGLDTWYTRFPQGGALDGFRFGGRFDLGLFERGVYPVRLYFDKAIYSYQDLVNDDPVTLLGGLPDSTTSWGGRLRIKRGFLHGLLLGLDMTELAFVGSDRRTETRSVFFGDWSKSGKKIQHHVRLNHEVRDYSRLDYTFRTTTLNWDEHGQLAPTWRWDFFTVGIRRVTDYDQNSAATDTLRLRSKFIHDFSEASVVDFGYSFGYAGAGGTSALDHQLEGRYRRTFDTGWELGPFVVINRRDVDDLQVSVLQGGLSATWVWASGAWDTNVSGTGSYGRTMYSADGQAATAPFWSAGISTTLGHGKSSGLRKVLEFGVARNEIKSVGEGDPNRPDLGIGFAAAGAQDNARARLSLFHDWKGGGISGWGEWRLREADSLIDESRLRAEDLLANVQVRMGSFSIVGDGGRTQTNQFRDAGQEISYYTGAVYWNPWHSTRIGASYRQDFRKLALAPDIDSDRIQATFEFQMGQLSMRAEFYQFTERLDVGAPRQNRGFYWTIRRGFAGWLPWVTGPQRRGVIR